MPDLDSLLGVSQAKALLVVASSGRDPDLAPFIGGARLGDSVLVVPRGEAPRLAVLSPLDRGEAEISGLELLDPDGLEMGQAARSTRGPVDFLAWVLRQALMNTGVGPGRVAIAGHYSAGVVLGACEALEQDGWNFVSGHELVRGVRKRKDVEQLSEIRRAAQGTMAAMRRVSEVLAHASLRPGPLDSDGAKGEELWFEGERLTVGRLRTDLGIVLARHGLEQPEGNIVAPAEEGAVPHNSGTAQRPLQASESLVVDLFPKARLFADCTRTFCVGAAPEALARAHQAVLEALLWSHEKAAVGVTGASLQEGVCECLESRGYATIRSEPGTKRGYVHGLGHGVGFELHELPSFRAPAESQPPSFGCLEEGDVITLEPGLYDPEAGFGVRLEDLCSVGSDGISNLTPLPYDLDPRAWTG